MIITLLLKKKKEKLKKEKKKEKKGEEIHIAILWRLYFYCTLHTIVFYTVVQQFIYAVAFLFAIFAALLFMYAATVDIRSWEKHNTVHFYEVAVV